MYHIDGSQNEAGSIREVIDIVLRYCDHSECAIFTVTSLGKQDTILGLTWLHKHNPEVDWKTEEVRMSCCPNHCRTCQCEANEASKTRIAEAASIHSCCMGPMPIPDVDMDDVPDLVDNDNNDDDNDDDDNDEPYTGNDLLKEGNHLFTATIPCKAEFIRATSNILQRLVEAFHKNLQPKTFHKSVPTHLHDFEDLFAKLSFDHLPDCKVWDHTIELVPGAKPSNCKVYPITPNEQVELDAFIHENLTSGRIRPSKSPYGIPGLLYQKEGWHTAVSTGLLHAKFHHSKKSLPPAANFRVSKPTVQREIFYKTRRLVGVQ